MLIRPTRHDEASLLPAIEAAAGNLFRGLPELAWLADEAPTSVREHECRIEAGLSWVAVDDDAENRIVGFLIADAHAEALHIEELSVHPAAQRRGVGAALLHRAIEEAERGGYAAATLTTFLDVPWNGPFYRRNGFEDMPAEELTEGLRAVLDAERAAGLPMARRGAMRRRMG